MAELKVLDVEAKDAGKIKLPAQFDEDVRPDLIKRAALAVHSHERQRYGATPEAGKRASAIISKRRHNYRGSYGYGISRTPRKIMSRRGTRMNWEGAFAPGTVGGRRAHPPKAEKVWWQKINKKERRKAIRSAIAATVNTDLVQERGHAPPKDYPFIVDSKIEDVDKTAKVKSTLKSLGFDNDLKRAAVKKVRAGKGTMRNRKYKKRVGPLVVVSKDCKLLKSSRNLEGVDVCLVKDLNTKLLAPGTIPGRLTVWSKAAVEELEKNKLFM